MKQESGAADAAHPGRADESASPAEPATLTPEDLVYLHRLVNADIASAKRLGAPEAHPHQTYRAKVLEKLSQIRLASQPTNQSSK